MVISRKKFQKAKELAALTTDLVIALGILASTMIPLSYSFLREQKLLRLSYQRAIAMEIVDGEMEILRAGEWKSFSEGAQAYPTQADAKTNLPSGKLTLTKHGERLRLEWKSKGVNIVREGEGQ